MKHWIEEGQRGGKNRKEEEEEEGKVVHKIRMRAGSCLIAACEMKMFLLFYNHKVFAPPAPLPSAPLPSSEDLNSLLLLL